jgi:hypothetical protein
MSTIDKSREKLLNSMRKTRKIINEQPDAKQEHAKTYASKTSEPSAAKTPPKTDIKKAKKPARKPSTSPQPPSDPYQSPGRIWPD